jgi:hypothetical protein
LFWHAVLKRHPGEAGFGLGIVALLVTTIHTGMLGALMTFSNGPWYPELAGRTAAYGLSPLEDQATCRTDHVGPDGLCLRGRGDAPGRRLVRGHGSAPRGDGD